MRYALPILIALQVALSPLCMTQMVHAESFADTDVLMSMASMDHAQHAHHMADPTRSHHPDPFPCGHGHCFSESALQSAPAPHFELPFTAAIPPTPCIFQNISADRCPLSPPKEPPPIVSSVETIVLLQ